jgi:3-keto-5-aminohexanoate cleavage enzyme
LEDRCIVVKEPRTQVASLNMCSVDMGEGANINLLSDIRYFIDRMKEANIKPELECFEFGMIHSCIRLAKEGLLSKPLNFNFTLGFDGALPDDPAYLAPIVERLPQGANWGFVHHGMTDLRMHAAALSLGAVMLRVGYEDGYYYAPGKVAASNAVLVEKLAELVHCLGFEVASPAEARKILGVEKL